jgi:hypothetical protein
MKSRNAAVFLGKTLGTALLVNRQRHNKAAQNTSSARRKMWGEDGNDARRIKLN